MTVKVVIDFGVPMELTVEELVKENLNCWKATRINGASASLACDSPGVCVELIKAFDEIRKLSKDLPQ